MEEKVLETIIQIASTAPSGANKQPWTYVLIRNKELLREFLCDDISYVIALFKQNYSINYNNGEKEIVKHYYVKDSVAISAGFLIGALKIAKIEFKILPLKAEVDYHSILKRPKYEKPFLFLGVKDKKTVDIDLLMNHYERMKERRSIRRFTNAKVNQNMIKQLIKNVDDIMEDVFSSKSYHFELVPYLQRQTIREHCEENEKRLYHQYISNEWKDALEPLGTGWEKPHLTEASQLVVVFNKDEEFRNQTGIAIGLFIQYLHLSHLSALTYTPSPMTFLKTLLEREDTPIMVLPIGYKANFYQLPVIKRKELKDILIKL